MINCMRVFIEERCFYATKKQLHWNVYKTNSLNESFESHLTITLRLSFYCKFEKQKKKSSEVVNL